MNASEREPKLKIYLHVCAIIYSVSRIFQVIWHAKCVSAILELNIKFFGEETKNLKELYSWMS